MKKELGKKVFALFLGLMVLTSSLVACNNSDGSTSNNSSASKGNIQQEYNGNKPGEGKFNKSQEDNKDIAKEHSYIDIVNRLNDLRSLAIKPEIGEESHQFSSYDRRSKYNERTNSYMNWGANKDGHGVIRRESGGGRVIAEMEGPGFISRVWSAEPKSGHIKIFIDGSEEPAIDTPFEELFSLPKTMVDKYDNLSYVSARGYNFYVPITYNESCKVVVYDDWGLYYLINYTTLPENHRIESFKMPLSEEQQEALAKVHSFCEEDIGASPMVDEDEEKVEKNIDIGASETTKIFETQEAGAIAGIRVRINNMDKPFDDWSALRELTISAYWDNQDDPSVWSPIGDFFGSACGLNSYKALPLGVEDDGWLYCYWYMPFEKGARLEIHNDGKITRNMDIEIITSPLDKPIDDLMRFHAKWTRMEDPDLDNERWPDSLFLDTQGKGRFLGFMLHVYKPNNQVDPNSGEGNWWWGEGDEKFFVDGEKFPSWYGTGTEDYFGYAWCDSTLFTKPFHSQIYNQGGVHGKGNKVVNRFQIIDNIPFQKSFEGYLEKYYGDEYARYASVSYWYLDPEGQDKYKPLSLEARTDYYEYLPQAKEQYEGEELYVKSFDRGIVETQPMKDFGDDWSNNEQLWWREGSKGDRLSLYFKTREKGRYKIKANLTTARDYGIVQFYINGNKIGSEIDAYSKDVSMTGEMELGTMDLEEGLHVIEVEITGKNPGSIAYMFGLDYLEIQPIDE